MPFVLSDLWLNEQGVIGTGALVRIIGDRYIASLFRVDEPVPMILTDLTFSYKKRKISGNDICFLFRLAYNSGFLCKFAAVKKNY